MKTIELGCIVFLVSLVFSLSLVSAYQYYFTTNFHQVQSGLVLLGATITVPDDYLTIQEAINTASDGDTIFVRNGTYYENVVMNKSVSLIGEDSDSTIIESGSTVIWIHEKDNVKVINFSIKGGDTGIDCSQSRNLEISGNKITRCNGRGLITSHSTGRISSNTLADNWIGILITSSYDLTLEGNQLFNNSFNFGIINYQLSSFTNISIDTTNTVNGKPIFWLLNQHDIVVNSTMFPDIGYLAIINSSNVMVENLNMTDNFQGVLLVYSQDCTIRNVFADFNYRGIEMLQSNSNMLTNNHLAHGWVAIKLEEVHNNTLYGNYMESYLDAGVEIHKSNNNEFINNTIIVDQDSLIITYSNNNTIIGNTIVLNDYGLVIGISYNNTIYHNNFLYNKGQLFSDICNNTWDNGCEGNYWSNYNGTDLNEDGIGDEYLPWEDVDIFPLVNPYWNPADINHDLEVNIYDVVAACTAYTSTPSDSHWNCHCDVAELYSIVDIFDIVMICSSYGEEYAS